MQPGIERRAHDAPRVPLDLWIRLSHEDYEGAFDADGVDLSAGGLALRSDYLPEIGDRLRCRFDCPPGSGQVEIDGEVVWAHDAGERSGEFGLRFAELGGDDEDNLRQLVEHLGGSANTTARLHLDGVATPIEAEITARDDEWMTVEQELPFLKLGMGVAVEGTNAPPRGRLASVDLRLEGGTPRLVLGVEYESGDGAAEIHAAEARAPEAHALATCDTLDEDGDVAAADEAVGSDATVQDFELPDSLQADAAPGAPAVEETPREEAREAVRVFRVERDGEDAPEVAAPGASDAAQIDAAEEAAPAAGMAGIAQRVTPALQKARAQTAELMEKARPALAAFWAKVVALFGVLAEKAGPGAKAAGAKVASVTSTLWAKIVSKVGKGRKRRTTAAPRKRVAQSPRRRRQHAQAEPPPKKRNRRIVLLSVLAYAGVGTAVYALSGSDEAEAAAAAEAPDDSEPSAAQDEPESEAASATPEASATNPEAGDVAEPEAGEPESEAEAGRLGEPTYPTLRDATERREAPVTEGTSFGADSVENGRSATLRMSQPVTTLRGQRQDDGFTVTIPGSLALDGASPIAASNPDVERAMILNRGDHAVLTVRFVAGRSPDYRVVAQGNSLEITIGR